MPKKRRISALCFAKISYDSLVAIRDPRATAGRRIRECPKYA